ncbi:MAG: DUF4167 domain-containing protein [Alphaproteobacteria bacterium]|nr:DUF4167 domain-containing protein [Alphaproteobacteria bacterium]MCD8563207.1 DUF4167 domain-containing protein [Alphaproteobacteria bacterium]
MRHGSSNRRQRNNRSARRGNPQRSQVFDSNGPDVRIRGTASQVAEKYEALAKDAAGAGDLILAESYLQHAEHYIRVMGVWAEERSSFSSSDQPVDNDDNDDADDDMGSENAGRFASRKSRPAPQQKPVQDDLGLPSSLFGASAPDGVEA